MELKREERGRSEGIGQVSQTFLFRKRCDVHEHLDDGTWASPLLA